MLMFIMQAKQSFLSRLEARLSYAMIRHNRVLQQPANNWNGDVIDRAPKFKNTILHGVHGNGHTV